MNPRVVKLMGRKCTGVVWLGDRKAEVLWDTGAQVCLVSKGWSDRYLPNVDIRPISDLWEGGTEVLLRSASGEVMPYVGWMQVPLSVPGFEQVSSMQVPFLVTNNCRVTRPIVGFNVIEELVSKNTENGIAESLRKVMSVILPYLDVKAVEGLINIVQ